VQDLFTPSDRVKRFGAIILTTVLAGCGGGGGSMTATALSLTMPDSYELRWSDEFTEAGPPDAAWSYDLGSPELGSGNVWGNFEKQFYTREASNVFVRNGLLTIQAIEGVPPEAPSGLGLVATSARITTNTDAYFNALNATPYGFYEIKAKVPCVSGAWPAIWLMGKTGSWPARGEIDIMEWFGSEFTTQPNQVLSAVHTRNHFGGNARSAKQEVTNMCDKFHRFQLHWSANEILIGVNGVPTVSYKKPKNASTDDWPFDQPAYLLLNVAVGGTNGGHVVPANLPAMTMQVDYVKVWQRP
jgi:beta-glucanase (GH16 family)